MEGKIFNNDKLIKNCENELVAVQSN